ncbi:MAG: alpha/beta hydrolase [Anaerolineaceae bacterium]|nr:alpha/beta hydrolase [Anaerolineaceae bacterium]
MVQHTEEKFVEANGIQLCYDTFGAERNPSLLLIMGLGSQMISWPDEFCAQLAQQGFWVIRFDNRDIGRSTRLDEADVPNVLAVMMSVGMGAAPSVPYLLKDMAQDTVGLLDALDIEKAHVVGASMGGMILQELLIRHPERVLTATSIMSTTSDPSLPQPKPEAMAILTTPAPIERDKYLDHAVGIWRVLHGDVFPIREEEIRTIAGRAYDRGLSPAGTARQMAAIFASGSRREGLKDVKVPTLVIHGDIDPLVPVEGGKDTAVHIPNAELMIIEGMGHSLPLEVWPRIIKAIANHAKQIGD